MKKIATVALCVAMGEFVAFEWMKLESDIVAWG